MPQARAGRSRRFLVMELDWMEVLSRHKTREQAEESLAVEVKGTPKSHRLGVVQILVEMDGEADSWLVGGRE